VAQVGNEVPTEKAGPAGDERGGHADDPARSVIRIGGE
jgi:hypothetical protein